MPNLNATDFSQSAFKLESEFEPGFTAWRKDPTRETTGAMLKQLQPVIDRGIRAHVGTADDPTIRGHARKLALGALRNYDPMKARLSTHVINHLQGLKRIRRTSSQILHVPERISLDRIRLDEAAAELEDRKGRPASLPELADYTGLSVRRIQHIRSFHHPIAEGQFRAHTGESGELEGYDPAVARDPSRLALELVYSDLGGINQQILDYSLGLHGQPQLPNQEIARRLRLSPGAITQRKAKIQELLDRTQALTN